MGKLRTKLVDQVRLPTCVASCHRPRAQRRTSYLAGPKLHTCHGSLPPLPFLPPLFSRSLPFPFLSPHGAPAEIKFGAF